MIGQNASANDIRRIVRHKHHEAIPMPVNQASTFQNHKRETNTPASISCRPHGKQDCRGAAPTATTSVTGSGLARSRGLHSGERLSPVQRQVQQPVSLSPVGPLSIFPYHRACLYLPNCYESPTLSNLQVIQMTMQKCRAVNSALGSKAFVPAPRIQFQAQRRFLQDVAITRTGKPILKVQGGR